MKLSFSKKDFYIAGFFISVAVFIGYHVTRYLMGADEEQKTLPLPGCENFKYLYGKLNNDTRTVVLGEFHDYSHLMACRQLTI